MFEQNAVRRKLNSSDAVRTIEPIMTAESHSGLTAMVREFTEESKGVACPTKPMPISRERIEWLVAMKVSEIIELLQTVCSSQYEAHELLTAIVAKNPDATVAHPNLIDDHDIVAAQADAMVDDLYYTLNVCSGHGINLDAFFAVVHRANMAKRDPTTGKFIIRASDGKIEKPPGWQPPDVRAEALRQHNEGTY